MSQTFTTRDDVRDHITEAIEAGGNAQASEYNLDTIVDACFTYGPAHGHIQDAGFTCTATTVEFWAAVQDAAYDELTAQFTETGDTHFVEDLGDTNTTVEVYDASIVISSPAGQVDTIAVRIRDGRLPDADNLDIEDWTDAHTARAIAALNAAGWTVVGDLTPSAPFTVRRASAHEER
ncbi:hypothetical protein [Dietzia sp. 179-F 9C3 NHS]|uniref:hypothetical protein n=1 Tax=Dietzia sp. 179-F 9C3 NHS TaxID=3374295 RepID=UPI0038796EDF